MHIVPCRPLVVCCWALSILPIVGQAPSSFTNPDAAWGQVGSAFSFQLGVEGEAPAGYAGGGFPPGIVLDPSAGTLRGTPRQAGDYQVHLAAVDRQHLPVAAQILRVLIYAAEGTPPPPIEGFETWATTVGATTEYHPRFLGDPGNIEPGLTFHWHDLPPGLTYDSNTNLLYGAATASGIFSSRLFVSNPHGSTEMAILWTVLPRSEQVESLSGVSALGFHESRFVAAGPGFLRYSDDGSDWHDANLALESFEAPRSIAHGEGWIVVPGRSRMLVSSDAVEWQAIPLGVESVFTHVVHGDDGFIAIAPSPLAIWRSDDGLSWTPVPWEGKGGFGSPISVLMHAGGVYLAVSEFGVYASTNGLVWARATGLPSPVKFQVAFADGQFYLAEPGNVLRNQWTSSDGVEWTRGAAPSRLGSGPITTPDDFRAYLLAPRADLETPRDPLKWGFDAFASNGNVTFVGSRRYEPVLPPAAAPRNLVAVAGEPVLIPRPRTVGEVNRVVIAGLPDGLIYDERTGAITGTAHELGSTRVAFAAEGPGGGSVIAQPVLHVVERSQLLREVRLDFQSPPQEEVAAEGSIQLVDDPLQGLVRWEAEGLPPGLNVDASTGRITGTPLEAGTFPVTFKANHPLQSGAWTREIKVRRAEWYRRTFEPRRLGPDWAVGTQVDRLLQGNGVVLAKIGTLVARTDDRGDSWQDTGLKNVVDIVFDGERFVAFDALNAKATATSVDGMDWTRHEWSSQAWMLGPFAAGPNGVLVAKNVDGGLVWSEDGATWAPSTGLQNVAGSLWDRPLVHGAGRFLIFPEGSKPYASVDGRTFTLLESFPEAASFTLHKVESHAGRVMALGLMLVDGTPQTAFLESVDGSAWTAFELVHSVNEPRASAFVDGLRLVLTDTALWHSIDGLNWQSTAFAVSPTWGTPDRLLTLAAGDGVLFAMSWENALYWRAPDFSPVLDFDDSLHHTSTTGAAFDFMIPVQGPFDEVIITGMLPPGLRVDSATGNIAGIVDAAAEAGDYHVTVEAAYRGFFSAPRTLRFAVRPAEGEAPAIADPLILVGREGERANQTLPFVVKGPGFEPSLEGIPGDLTVTSEGILSGSFPAAGRYEGFIHAGNAYGTHTSRLVLYVANRVFTDVRASISLRVVTSDPGLFVAAGLSRGILVSPDGMAWEQLADLQNYQIRSIRRLRDHFYATGVAFENERAVIMVSGDGREWRTVFPDSDEEQAQAIEDRLMEITDGTHGLIAVGREGSVIQSTDGEIWSSRTIARAADPVSFTSVAFGNGRYVAALADGELMSSPDGQNWLEATLPNVRPDSLAQAKVAFGLDAFWVAGNRLFLLRSEDGIAWTVVQPPVGNDFLSGIDWHAGELWVTGKKGLVMHTSDGATWHKRTLDIRYDLAGIALKEGRYAAYSYYKEGIFLVDTPLPPSLGLLPREAFAIAEEPWDVEVPLSQPATLTDILGLPKGLVWNAETARLSGTPQEPGTYDLTYVAQGPSGLSVAVAPWIVEPREIEPPLVALPSPALLPQTSPAPALAIRGLGPGSEITLTGLPKGIFLAESTLTWSGVPLEYGSFDCHLQITNRAGVAAQRFVLWTQPESQGSVSTLAPRAYGVLGEGLSYSWAGGGVDFHYDFDTLPEGIAYDPVSLSLKGRPAVEGTFQSVVSISHPGGVQRGLLTFVFLESNVAPTVPSPSLEVIRAGGAIQVRWPIDRGEGWSLESSLDLMHWSPVGLPIQDDGVSATVSIPLERVSYFRLVR